MSNGTGDIATQIKALFNRRYDLIKEKKRKRIILIIAIIIFIVAVIFGIRAVVLRIMNDKKDLELAELQLELQSQKSQIESQIKEIEEAKSKASDDVLERLEQAEIIAQNNLYLVEQNIKLQNQIKEAAKAGVKPQNYGKTEEVTEAVDYSKLEYVGEFEGTAYTPSVQECGNNLGYTASGKPIIAGVSIAVDTAYWKLGTEFYIEGLGYVIAMDTGGAIKGKYRFDYAVFDRDYAKQIGRRKYNVYLVKNEE
ncbi:MAG: 3D domain-containing protein [Clostridia bacterium]|nr:3D domain-containing protein [Clostridia bacterium]